MTALLLQWFCATCVEASTATSKPVETTYKAPPRKSARGARQLDYANLAAHLPSDVDKWMRVVATRTVVEGAFAVYEGKDLTDEWLWGKESMLQPFVVESPEGLGMEMPSRDMSIPEIAAVVGPNTPIEVIGD